MTTNLLGIAQVVEVKSDVFQAQILLNDNLKPIELLCRGSILDVVTTLSEQYPKVEVVHNQVFLCELDHISLFNSRSTDKCWS